MLMQPPAVQSMSQPFQSILAQKKQREISGLNGSSMHAIEVRKRPVATIVAAAAVVAPLLVPQEVCNCQPV